MLISASKVLILSTDIRTSTVSEVLSQIQIYVWHLLFNFSFGSSKLESFKLWNFQITEFRLQNAKAPTFRAEPRRVLGKNSRRKHEIISWNRFLKSAPRTTETADRWWSAAAHYNAIKWRLLGKSHIARCEHFHIVIIHNNRTSNPEFGNFHSFRGIVSSRNFRWNYFSKVISLKFNAKEMTSNDQLKRIFNFKLSLSNWYFDFGHTFPTRISLFSMVSP